MIYLPISSCLLTILGTEFNFNFEIVERHSLESRAASLQYLIGDVVTALSLI
jgi:hypothetical protein